MRCIETCVIYVVTYETEVIKSNMRCIETVPESIFDYEDSKIKSNMRCIETLFSVCHFIE